MFEALFEEETLCIDARFSEAIEGGSSERINYGEGLRFDPDTRTLSVDTTDDITEWDNRPISSNGIWKEIHGIEELLKEI